MEFEKNEAAITVGSLKKLAGAIDALVKALRAGQPELKQSSKSPRPIRSGKVS